MVAEALPPPKRHKTLSALHRLALEPIDPTAPDARPDPSRPIPKLVNEAIPLRFLLHAGMTPDLTAIEWHGGSISYGQLELLSRRIALRLMRAGVGKGHVVGLFSDRNPALPASMLGVLRAGACFSVLDAAYPAPKLVKLAGKMRPSAVLVCGGDELVMPAELKAAIAQIPMLAIHEDATKALAALAPHVVDDDALPDIDHNSDAYIMFTSGTTGEPKSVVTTHSPLVHFIQWHRSQHALTQADRFSNLSGLSHDPVLRDIFTPLSLGATLCIPQQQTIFNPARLAAWFVEKGISVCHLTPALGEIIAGGAEGSGELGRMNVVLDKLRHFFWGGDALNQKIMRRMQGVAPMVRQTNFYGATETPQAMGFYPIEPVSELEAFPVGRGIDATQLLVVNNDGKLCAFGELGEVWIRTPYLSNGYKGDTGQTGSKFVPNPFRGNDPNDLCYKTGDLGRYLPDGSVALAGRVDFQLKIRGFRVEPGEVLAALEALPGIARAVVFAKDMAGQGKVLCAYYADDKKQGVDTPPPTPHSVKDALKKQLPSYMVPTYVVSIEAFPLLPNGKIDYAALPPPDRQDVSRAANFVAASTDQEKQLVKLWQEVLGVESVGVTDSFLDLGGDSLSALNVLMRMQKFGIPDHIGRGILQGKTIRQLCAGPPAPGEVEELAPQAQTNLLVNVIRGVLVTVVISEHILAGFWADVLERLVPVLGPIFNLATPGFAMVFGVSLGYGYYKKYLQNPPQTIRSLRIGGAVLVVAIIIGGLVRYAVQPLTGKAFDSTSFAMSFLNALFYYAMAIATVNLWFWLISRFPAVKLKGGLQVALATQRQPGNAYLGVLMLMGIMLVGSTVAFKLVGHLEVTGFLYLMKQMLIAKFNYFKMSIGVLTGMLCGIALKDRVKMPPSLPLVGVAVALATAAVGLLFVLDKNVKMLTVGGDMRLWRWVFCAGLVSLIAAGATSAIRVNLGVVRKAVQLAGVVGQCALPLFVIHVLIIDVHNILAALELPYVVTVALPLVAFTVVAGLIIHRLYTLYYGALVSTSGPTTPEPQTRPQPA